MSRSRGSRLKTGPTAEVGFFLLMAGVPAALGAVHRPTQLLAALATLVTFYLVWRHRRHRQAPMRLSWFGRVLILASAYTLFQLVPLPLVVHKYLAPASLDLLRVSLAEAGGLPRFHPISLDPGATLWAALRMVSCTLAFLAAYNFYYRKERVRRLLAVLAVAGAVQLLIGLLGAVVAPGKPLLLYTPRSGWTAGLISTSFVNPNHGAAYLTLAALAALGLAFALQDVQRRLIMGLLGVVVGAGVFLTLSRGGMLGLAAGAGAFTVMLLLYTAQQGAARWALLVPLALAGGLALAAWGGVDAVLRPYTAMVSAEGAVDLGKIHLWPSGLAMVQGNAWLGVGRGAFLTAFPRYLEGDFPRVTFSHLENQYLHLPAEWGLPVALLVIGSAALAWLFWVRWGSVKPTVLAAAAALLALAVHNLFDFNLEMLGVALPAALLAGAISTMCAHARNDLPLVVQRWVKHVSLKRWQVRTLIATVALMLAGTVALWPPSSEDDFRRVLALDKGGAPADKVVAAAHAAMRRHPADYLPHLALAHHRLGQQQPEALASLNRALYLYPRSPQIHLEVAETLRALGRRRQALLEYRMAMTYGDRRMPVIRRALSLCQSAADVAQVLPELPRVHLRAVEYFAGRYRKEKDRALLELAFAAAASAAQRWPKDPDLAEAELSVRLIQAGLLCEGEGAAERARCAEEAAKVAARAAEVVKVQPVDSAYVLWARALDLAGQRERAVEVLKAGREELPRRWKLWLALGKLLLKYDQLAEAEEVLKQVVAQSGERNDLIRAHLSLANVMTAAGRKHSAAYHLEQVRKLQGGD